LKVITEPDAFHAAMDRARAEGAVVGLVPTMGALHAGHLSLLNRARSEADHVAMSLFVNPLQFDAPADLAAYPRPVEADLTIAEDAGCDTVFAPTEDAMYPGGRPSVTVDPGPLGERYEGAVRPGHFRGVLTIVAKLFHLTGPCRSYFGQKDAQQLELVHRMVDQLDVPVTIVGCPIVRDPDGLALSSRNVRLSAEEREAALSLSRALHVAERLFADGERSAAVISTAMRERIESEALADLDYATVVDAAWEEPATLEGPARAIDAARFGSTRLIDNAALGGAR
jgi:pantoate--beta-alanine ligase